MSSQNLIESVAKRFNLDESKLIETLKATAFKQHDDREITNEQLMTLLIVAEKYGLDPFTKELYAFPDKKSGIIPIVGVDGWSRIINQHEMFDGMMFNFSDELVEPSFAKKCPTWIECVIYRRDRAHPIKIREHLDEVYREPFEGVGKNGPYRINGPWQSHTKRMLRHKAMIQCSRIAFGFVGIFDHDEAERIIEGEVIQPVESVQIDPNHIELPTREKIDRIIDRAKQAGAWKSALDYLGEMYSGQTLLFARQRLLDAEQLAKTLAEPQDVTTTMDSVTHEVIPNEVKHEDH